MATSRKAVLTAVVSDLVIAAASSPLLCSATPPQCSWKAFIRSWMPGMAPCLFLVYIAVGVLHDETHPFGYGKELYFWTRSVTLFIFLVGSGVSNADGIQHLRHPATIDHIVWNYLTLEISACFEGYPLWIGLTEFPRLKVSQRRFAQFTRAKTRTKSTVLGRQPTTTTSCKDLASKLKRGVLELSVLAPCQTVLGAITWRVPIVLLCCSQSYC